MSDARVTSSLIIWVSCDKHREPQPDLTRSCASASRRNTLRPSDGGQWVPAGILREKIPAGHDKPPPFPSHPPRRQAIPLPACPTSHVIPTLARQPRPAPYLPLPALSSPDDPPHPYSRHAPEADGQQASSKDAGSRFDSRRGFESPPGAL